MRREGDKMSGEKPRNLYAKKNQIDKIINYFNKIGNIYNATIELPNNQKAKIQPYEGKIEIMCSDSETIDKLEEILKND